MTCFLTDYRALWQTASVQGLLATSPAFWPLISFRIITESLNYALHHYGSCPLEKFATLGFSLSLALFSLNVLYFVYIKPCYVDYGSS